MEEKRQLGVAVSIVERGHGSAVVRFLSERNLLFHWQCSGRGTASSDMLDLLGIGSGEKDVVISLGERESRDAAVAELAASDLKLGSCKGFGFTLKLSAVSNLLAQAQFAGLDENRRSGVTYMKEERKNSLILAAVERGLTDEVMDAARRAGARGGTVLRARMSGGEHLEQLYGITVQPEQEILAILVEGERRNQVMEAIQTEYGLRSGAHGTLCALPVEQAFRMG